VNSTFSGCRVTIEGAAVPAPPPPENVVREKLVFTRTFRFKYEFKPTDQASANPNRLPRLSEFIEDKGRIIR